MQCLLLHIHGTLEVVLQYKLFCTVAFIVNIRIFKSNLVDLAYKSFEYLAVLPVVLIWMLVLLERYHICFDSETHLSLTMIGKTSVTCWPLMSISVSMSWNTVLNSLVRFSSSMEPNCLLPCICLYENCCCDPWAD